MLGLSTVGFRNRLLDLGAAGSPHSHTGSVMPRKAIIRSSTPRRAIRGPPLHFTCWMPCSRNDERGESPCQFSCARPVCFAAAGDGKHASQTTVIESKRWTAEKPIPWAGETPALLDGYESKAIDGSGPSLREGTDAESKHTETEIKHWLHPYGWRNSLCRLQRLQTRPL